MFSQPGKPRGRGKIERYFETINQVCLPTLPGYAPRGTKDRASVSLRAASHFCATASIFGGMAIGGFHDGMRSTSTAAASFAGVPAHPRVAHSRGRNSATTGLIALRPSGPCHFTTKAAKISHMVQAIKTTMADSAPHIRDQLL